MMGFWRIQLVMELLQVAYTFCMQDLRSKLEKAESVLKLAEMCRKLETEQEKVIPFWSITAVSGTAEGEQAEDGILNKQQQQILKGLQQQQDAAVNGSQASGSSNAEQEQQGLAGVAEQQLEGGAADAGAADGASSSNVPKLSAVGLDDAGKEVEEWDYLNK